MQPNQRVLIARSLCRLALSTLLASGPASAMAQHTVVNKNGESGTIEMDYDASEKVTQMRTMAADGKLQQKVEYRYLPGYYSAQQTDTTYWANGKVRKVVEKAYDESSNFTGEFIEAFDESGKQIAGHKLTHDPWRGVYRCSEWSVAAPEYRAVECPAGEEKSGGPETAKRFTIAEVMGHLETARKTARQEKKMGQLQPGTPVHPPVTIANREVGLVLPAEVRPGERVSGRVVENASQYEGFPEIKVTRLEVPFESDGEASRMWGWFFESPGESQQRADGPVTFVVPPPGSGLGITLRQAGNPAHTVSITLTFPRSRAKIPPAPKSFTAAALCLKGEACVVSGRFSGDSRKTFAAFEDRPATILAETSDRAFILVPELTEPGARPLFIAEESRAIALPVVVGEFFIKNNHRELGRGEKLIMFPTLNGPGEIPEAQWRSDYFPAGNLARAEELIPSFRLSTGDRKDNDEPERDGGEILLVVKNATPEQISLRGSQNDMLVFRLGDEAFGRGEFKYDLLVETKQAGRIDVKGYVIPFLAPIRGQEFGLKTATP